MTESATGKKVFIKTFGCQMNEYDSDKMVDVLRQAEGYEPTSDVEQADLILFNTCSVREKAQEKVFSDLGRVKHLKEKGVLIGVGGCVASQEGAAIISRAPYVDVVFGPQTLHRLPDLLQRRISQERSQVDISFPEIEKFDNLPVARAEGGNLRGGLKGEEEGEDEVAAGEAAFVRRAHALEPLRHGFVGLFFHTAGARLRWALRDSVPNPRGDRFIRRARTLS
jgi:hypothetical protein